MESALKLQSTVMQEGQIKCVLLKLNEVDYSM